MAAAPGVRVAIVTTKQARFTHALLRDLGGVEVPMEQIFSQTVSGRPKGEVLQQLAQGAAPGARLLFVEDKASTLAAVARTPGLEGWELLLADWGYNTEGERRAAAAAAGRVRLVGLPQFVELLSGCADGL
jgi:phosphoglycolate phosphatase-like HAD superfamily hydrolase